MARVVFSTEFVCGGEIEERRGGVGMPFVFKAGRQQDETKLGGAVRCDVSAASREGFSCGTQVHARICMVCSRIFAGVHLFNNTPDI